MSINFWALVILPVILFLATANFFKDFFFIKDGWPETLLREEEDTAFHEFKTFVNIFPCFEPGQNNPTKLLAFPNNLG